MQLLFTKNELLSQIIIGCIATLFVEICFVVIKWMFTHIKVKSQPFSLQGYWLGVSCEIGNDNKCYKGYEINKISYITLDKIRIKIYQIINDGRYYKYIGCGYIRGDKIVLAYEEQDSPESRMIGAYEFRFGNKKEHSTNLKGHYIEQRESETEVVANPYIANRIELSLIEQCYLFLFNNSRFARKKLLNRMMEEVNETSL